MIVIFMIIPATPSNPSSNPSSNPAEGPHWRRSEPWRRRCGAPGRTKPWSGRRRRRSCALAKMGESMGNPMEILWKSYGNPWENGKSYENPMGIYGKMGNPVENPKNPWWMAWNPTVFMELCGGRNEELWEDRSTWVFFVPWEGMRWEVDAILDGIHVGGKKRCEGIQFFWKTSVFDLGDSRLRMTNQKVRIWEKIA